MTKTFKSWGWYQVLHESQGLKVKLLHINPKSETSEQWHQHRSEHWHVLSGGIAAKLGDVTTHLGASETIDIPHKAIHQLRNLDDRPAEVLEIQRGYKCEESDIVRISDGY